MFWHDVAVGVPVRQFNKMMERVSGRRGRVPARDGERPATSATHRVILGIDPSLRGTGYGVIRLGNTGPELLAQGVLKCPREWTRSQCLVRINRELQSLVSQWQPTVCVVEGLFYAQNLRTAIVMGEARGAGLAAVGSAGLEVYEIAPRRVKQAIVGHGGAAKIAVAKMVQSLLGLPKTPEPDAADALALALTFVHEQGRYSPKALKRV